MDKVGEFLSVHWSAFKSFCESLLWGALLAVGILLLPYFVSHTIRLDLLFGATLFVGVSFESKISWKRLCCESEESERLLGVYFLWITFLFAAVLGLLAFQLSSHSLGVASLAFLMGTAIVPLARRIEEACPTGKRLRHLSREALEELRRQGVRGLPKREGPACSAFWAEPTLWLALGFLLAVLLIVFLRGEPALTAVRREEDLFPIRGEEPGGLILFGLLVIQGWTFFAGRLLMRVLGVLSSLQLIGESWAYLPWLGRKLLCWSVRAGATWEQVQRRFLQHLFAVWLLLGCMIGAAVYQTHHAYHAISSLGVREERLGRVVLHDWSELQEIRSFCERKAVAGKARFFYELHFKRGQFNLIRSDQQGLDLLDELDRNLLEKGFPKKSLSLEKAKRCTSQLPEESKRSLLVKILSRSGSSSR